MATIKTTKNLKNVTFGIKPISTISTAEGALEDPDKPVLSKEDPDKPVLSKDDL